MRYQLSDILTATGGTCSAESGSFEGINKDTRTTEAGNLYVALVGERLDGHDFVADALAKGAHFALVERLVEDAPQEQQIIVPDTLKALQDFAHYRRHHSDMHIIGVTGSVGKTSAKEMLVHVIGAQAACYGTQGNYNNHIGLPLTLLNTPADTDYLVLEMGMNHAGEIALLSRIAEPDVALITTIDAVHLEFFNSVADIARAKAEIVEGMPIDAPLIIPTDTPHYGLLHSLTTEHGQRPISFGNTDHANYRLERAHVGLDGTHTEIEANGTLLELHIGAAGAHHASNALAVLAACDALGLDLAKAAASLRSFKEPHGRGRLEQVAWGDGHITIIDESYNASPIAMRAAFARARALAGNGRVIAVLGDMLELGDTAPALHAELAESIREHQLDAVYCTGELMQHLANALPIAQHHQDKQALIKALTHDVTAQHIILVKGSRGSRMEEVIQHFHR